MIRDVSQLKQQLTENSHQWSYVVEQRISAEVQDILSTLLLARLMDQCCFARGRLPFVVVVCNAAGGRAGRRVANRPPPGRARGRSGGRHCTAGQYCYVR